MLVFLRIFASLEIEKYKSYDKEKTINLSSNRTIRKASTDDFTIVSKLIEQGKAKMIKTGNPNQWSANYPAESTIRRDIAQGDCYLLYECGKPIATFVAKAGPEPNYHRIDMVVGLMTNLIMSSIVWLLWKVYMV